MQFLYELVYKADFARLYRQGTENGLEIYTQSILKNGTYRDQHTFGIGPRGMKEGILESTKRMTDDLSDKVRRGEI